MSTPPLVYGCESWGNHLVPAIDSCFRQGLKTALSIRQSMNNEITYIESGRFPLSIRVRKQQLKFWLSLKELDPQHHISKFIALGQSLNLPFLNHYTNLQTLYGNPRNYQDVLRSKFTATIKEKIQFESSTDLTPGLEHIMNVILYWSNLVLFPSSNRIV